MPQSCLAALSMAPQANRGQSMPENMVQAFCSTWSRFFTNSSPKWQAQRARRVWAQFLDWDRSSVQGGVILMMDQIQRRVTNTYQQYIELQNAKKNIRYNGKCLKLLQILRWWKIWPYMLWWGKAVNQIISNQNVILLSLYGFIFFQILRLLNFQGKEVFPKPNINLLPNHPKHWNSSPALSNIGAFRGS